MVTRDIVQRLLNVINDTRRRVNTLESREYVLLNATQTLTNKTLTTPTIGDFSNAQHSHANAAGGGQLSLTTAVSGVLPPANGGTGVNNATRTLTINTNSGTLAFSGTGYTLTIPATGTAALLGTANVFTAAQTVPRIVVSSNIFPLGTLERTSAANASFEMKNTAGTMYFGVDPGGNFAIGVNANLATSPNIHFSNATLNVGIGTTSPSAQLHVDQSSASGAKPTLRLRQADLSEEFIRFDATVGAGNPINTTALGAYYGRVRVYVEGVGEKWLALYD